MGVKFKASLWSIKRDCHDECTVILKVPSTDAITVIGLPTEQLLDVEITNAQEG
jgi:hypothetical protein